MIRNFIVALCMVLLTISCSKDTDDKLEGKWQLKEVILENGQVQPVDTVWYNFMNSLFMYQLYDTARVGDNKYRHSYGFKTWDGDSLMLELTSDPQLVKDFLPYTDWDEQRRMFLIEEVNGKELILTSEGSQYNFRKF